MSRKYKVSSIYQADNAINDLNDYIDSSLRDIDRRFNDLRNEASRTAQIRAREETEKAKREMQSRLNSAITGVNVRIAQVDAEQRQRLNKVANDIYNTIAQAGDSLHAEIGQLAAHVEKKLAQQQTQIDSHSRQLSSLTQTVSSILAQMADERQKRREAVSLAQDIRSAAYGRIDIERFCPQKSEEISRRMAALAASCDDEGTVARASEVILQTQMAEEEALRNKIIYDTIHAEATAMLEKTLKEVNGNREISIAHPDSPEDKATIETDFWNRGEYEKLRGRLNALKAELQGQPALQRIKEIMEEAAVGEARLADMVGKAAKSAILSENRVVMAEDIITALVGQGWQVEKMADGQDAVGYVGGEDCDNDWREGVFAVLQSMNGERISIVVQPDETETVNDIIFHRNDNRSITDLEYIRSLERIKQQIAKSGYKLGATETPADGGDDEIPEMADTAKLGKAGAARKICQRARRR